MKVTFLALPAALLLCACGNGETPRESDTIGKEIADDYNRALDDAAAVETELDAARERMDEALEEADGGSP